MQVLFVLYTNLKMININICEYNGSNLYVSEMIRSEIQKRGNLDQKQIKTIFICSIFSKGQNRKSDEYHYNMVESEIEKATIM
jgi:hypothetical protein